MGGRERRRRGGTPRDPNLERSYRFLHPRRRRPRRRRPGAAVGGTLASEETLGEKRVRQLDANRRHDPGGNRNGPRPSPAARETRERRERPSTESRGGVELLETPLGERRSQVWVPGDSSPPASSGEGSTCSARDALARG